MLRVGALVLVAAAVVALALKGVGDRTDRRPNRQERRSSPTPENRGTEHSEQPSKNSSKIVPPSIETTLERLRSETPAGNEAEYLLTKFTTGARPDQSAISDLVRHICGVDFFIAPPFCARWMFSSSDLKWLRATKAALDDRLASTSSDASRESVREVFRTLLIEVARNRLRQAPKLAARFDDARSLRELKSEPSAESQYLWLRYVMGPVVPGHLLIVKLNVVEDFQYFSAVDLRELAKLRADLYASYDATTQRPNSRREEVEFHRPFAERLEALIKAKKQAGS